MSDENFLKSKPVIKNGKWTLNGNSYLEMNDFEKLFFQNFIKRKKIKLNPTEYLSDSLVDDFIKPSEFRRGFDLLVPKDLEIKSISFIYGTQKAKKNYFLRFYEELKKIIKNERRNL